MRILTLAAIAALGLTAACNDRDGYDRTDAAADQSAAATDYSADAAADAARSANASAAAAADAARDAASTSRTVVVQDSDRDNDGVTVQVGPDGPKVNATIDTD
ncbi:MAG TPA: hypothetical protein VFX95_10720 [Caulobacteraceae bacterium]|nr:hypothetical protein [Caulobacteraceae bacterium]